MRLNKLQIAELCSQYQLGASTCQLSKVYGISETAICGLLQRRGIERRAAYDPVHRKHTLNNSAFDTITEESAYWIGFLMADGSLIERSTHSVQLSLGLHERDRSHLEQFRQFLGSSHAISTVTTPNTACRLTIRSKALADALAQYGVLPGKTHTAKVIKLESNRDFWRGVVDGDGFLGFRNQKPRLELVGSAPLLEQFLTFLRERLDTCKLTIRPDHAIYKIAAGNGTAYSIVKVLYERCSIALPRKLEIASCILG